MQITDGSIGVGSIGRNRIVQALPLPPSYPAKIHVLPVVSPHDTSLQHGKLLTRNLTVAQSCQGDDSKIYIATRNTI